MVRECRTAMTMPSLRLLHVEDDPMDVRLFGMMLRELAVPDDAVQRVPSLRGALDALADDAIDLVFLDLDLPDSRGLETAERLLAARTDVPVVVLTGNRDEELGSRPWPWVPRTTSSRTRSTRRCSGGCSAMRWCASGSPPSGRATAPARRRPTPGAGRPPRPEPPWSTRSTCT
jgi:CheY-like chemotaxis protein